MSFVNTVDLVGDEVLAARIIDKSITEIADNISQKIGDFAFINCNALTKVDFRAATSVGHNAFRSTTLSTVDLYSATTIENSFGYCSALKTLILRGGTVCALTNTNALNGTAIANGNGYIYVPSSLVNAYKGATNWSSKAAQFRALEDYTVDGTITGELDEAKI